MHRSLSAVALLASLVVLLPARAAGPDISGALSRARTLLDADNPRAAVPILEDALPSVAPEERPALLEMLRTTYDRAARRAEAEGRKDLAAEYRENLDILVRKPRTEPVPTPAPASAPPAAQARPNATVDPAQAPAPFDPEVIRAASLAPVGPLPPPEPASIPEPVRAPTPAPAAAPAPTVEQLVASADAAFVGRRYGEAGRIYAALDRERHLPASRRDHWAYCRWVDVVQRINAGPRTPQEWASIDAEIEQIRALSPKNWFGEYLRNRAAERSAGRRNGRPGQVVVRGSSPDEAPARPRLRRAPAPVPRAVPGPEADARPDSPGTLRPAPPAGEPSSHEVNRAPIGPGNWQVRETPSFRILHADGEMAEKVAQAAEETREVQTRRWSGSIPREAWSPKCDIYLYPTAKVYAEMTGQPETSPGFSTMGMNGGRIIARRINLRADHPNILEAVLPHEITHVILADLFPTQQIPRWADEGIAVLSEPASEQRLRASDLDEPLASGQLFKVSDLMALDYPDGRYWGLYYAQCVSLTRFLVEQGTPAQFVQFVQGSQRLGPEAELKRIYKIEGFADLQERWLAYARSQTSAANVAAAANGTARR